MLVKLVRRRASRSCRKPVIHLVAFGTENQPACGLDLPGRPVVEQSDSNEIECFDCSVIYAARRLKEDEVRENYRGPGPRGFEKVWRVKLDGDDE